MHVLYQGLSIRPPTDLVIMVCLPGADRRCKPCRLVVVRCEPVGSRLSLWFVVCLVQTAVVRSLERNTYRV